MGLDNIWKKNKEENGFIEGDFKLCGGGGCARACGWRAGCLGQRL